MAYTNYDEVILRYNSIATWQTSDANGSTETKVNSNLVYFAEVELNSKLAANFSVPFTTVYPTIKDLAIDFCYYKALSWRDPLKAKEIQEMLYERIDNINKGKDYIYTDSGTIVDPDAKGGPTIWSSTQDYAPTHSMLDAEDSVTHIDSNYQQDLEDARE